MSVRFGGPSGDLVQRDRIERERKQFLWDILFCMGLMIACPLVAFLLYSKFGGGSAAASIFWGFMGGAMLGLGIVFRRKEHHG